MGLQSDGIEFGGVILEWDDRVDCRVQGRNIGQKGQNVGNRKGVENGENIGKVESQNGNGLQNLVHNINMATASSLDVPVLEYKSTDFCSILFDFNRSV